MPTQHGWMLLDAAEWRPVAKCQWSDSDCIPQAQPSAISRTRNIGLTHSRGIADGSPIHMKPKKSKHHRSESVRLQRLCRKSDERIHSSTMSIGVNSSSTRSTRHQHGQLVQTGSERGPASLEKSHAFGVDGDGGHRFIDARPVHSGSLRVAHPKTGLKRVDRACRCQRKRSATQKTHWSHVAIVALSADGFDEAPPPRAFSISSFSTFGGAVDAESVCPIDRSPLRYCRLNRSADIFEQLSLHTKCQSLVCSNSRTSL